DIDDFIIALPVKQMNDLYVAICRGEDDRALNFIWMMRWQETCMELSEVSQNVYRGWLRVMISMFVFNMKM
ncbi:hypothetical protein PHYSODRAFT_534471, partial [Phytophthora sojae]